MIYEMTLTNGHTGETMRIGTYHDHAHLPEALQRARGIYFGRKGEIDYSHLTATCDGSTISIAETK